MFGLYQSCKRCDQFMACSGSRLTMMDCQPGLSWDQYRKRCEYVSSTCNAVKRPGEKTTTTPPPTTTTPYGKCAFIANLNIFYFTLLARHYAFRLQIECYVIAIQ